MAGTPGGGGRCAEHAKVKRQARGAERADKKRIYNSKKWRLTRRAQLNGTPLCQFLDEQGEPCNRVATDVHHIEGVEASDPYDLTTLESLCHRHHSMLTRDRQLAGFQG